MSNPDRREYALDLLADKALYGSSPALDAELDALRAQGVVGDDDLRDLEASVAALHMLAGTTRVAPEPLPPHLRDAIVQSAPGANHVHNTHMHPARKPRSALAGTVPMLGAPPRPAEAPQRARSVFRAPSTWLAMAACLLVGIGGTWQLLRQRQDPNELVAEVTPAQARASLLATSPDVVTLTWTATADPAARGAGGDVVWSAREQRGFMRFTGLAANDPRQSQYQLWIFDAKRDEKFPVDGGVFDVPASGEVVIPIDARVPVSEATLFAVTVEAPGGVVVSKRERIVTTAAPSKS